MRSTRSFHRIPRATALLLLPLVLAACGDEEILALDDRVSFELFTEVEQQVNGSGRYTQRATVTLSPSLSRADLEEITRMRLVHELGSDWLLGSGEDFVAGDGGWVFVAERSAGGQVRVGAWDLRMVVEEQGVHVAERVLRSGAVSAPLFNTTRVTPEGEVTLVWSHPRESYDWELRLVRRTPVAETEGGDTEFVEEILAEAQGVGRGGGAQTLGFDVPTSAFEPPHQLLFRLVMVNDVSRRTVEGLLAPE